MLATVSLMAGEGDSVLHIPRSALIRDGSRARVVIALGEGRFTSRDVVAGAESGDRIAIHEGLEGGERVVVAAQFLLDSEANLGAGLDRLDDGAGAASTPPPAADPHAGHRQ
jgi:Cu(I)/Ag(I) efflux system membrane fusion protein